MVGRLMALKEKDSLTHVRPARRHHEAPASRQIRVRRGRSPPGRGGLNALTIIARATAWLKRGPEKEKDREMSTMQQLSIGKAAASPQNETASKTTTPSQPTIRTSGPWIGQTRPVEGRLAQLLVYDRPIAKNSRGEDVFVAVIGETDPVTEEAHAHRETGAMPRVKKVIVEKVWAAREQGGLDFASCIPPEQYQAPKAIAEEARYAARDIEAFRDAMVAQDYTRAHTQALEISKRFANLAPRLEGLVAK